MWLAILAMTLWALTVGVLTAAPQLLLPMLQSVGGAQPVAELKHRLG